MDAMQLDEEAIFHAARKITDREDRAAYLALACGNDAALCRRVERLVRVGEQEVDFLDAPACDATADVTEEGERPGAMIGPFKLLEPIGEGGMGTVYMAEQARPVRRKVALKIIKPGMDSKQVVARFESERQALALMDHPNIARVLDAGATHSGRPYFVMELVRGVPITEYCDREQLPVATRLDLFVLVCRAVQHAHQKGIIHRDIKPSNVLVTLHDGVPVPKVIDFGIAKATGQSLTDRTLFTGFAQLVGTPLYMSPEQAEMSGLDVDTRSDIYSLGVLLYELLTGTTPFDSETLKKAAFDEMRRIIREEEPPRPSTRLSSLGATLTTVSARRGADPRHLGRAVRGELDWIAMKALEKDRRRRYETANDLAADVLNYLADRPVEACPPSAGYRLGKYARRHRVGLTTGALVGLALIAGTAASTWQAAQARKAQGRAEAAEGRATAEAAIARAVSDFLQGDLLGQAAGMPRSGPDEREGSALTVREALDRASARIGGRFRGQPLVEAAIRTTIGTAYNHLQQHPSAVPHLERAVALRTAHLGETHPETLASLHHLAAAYGGMGRAAEGIALRGRIVSAREASLGPDAPETLAAVGELAEAYRVASRWDESRRLLEDLLVRQARTCGPTHADTLGTLHHLALVAYNTDRIAESLDLHERLLTLLAASDAHGAGSTIWPRVTFARVCQRAGELDQAERLLGEAFELLEKVEDDQKRRLQLANIRGWQAVNRVLRRDYLGAEPLAREAVAIFEQLRPDDQRRFYWDSVLGEALLGQRRYTESEPLLLLGYRGMKEREALLPVMDRRRMATACERLVRLYRTTQQSEKERAWSETLATLPPPD